MKALAVKTRRVAGLVTHLAQATSMLFGDRGIFFREFSEELAHPFYPEIAVVQRAGSQYWFPRAARSMDTACWSAQSRRRGFT
jgi:hypothetical protein